MESTTIATDRDLGLVDKTYSLHLCTVEQMSAAASHLRNNWGEYGYRLGVVESGSSFAIFGARCSDGSEFFFAVDRYGIVTDIPQAERIFDITIS